MAVQMTLYDSYMESESICSLTGIIMPHVIWNMSSEIISAIFLIHIPRHDFVYHIVYSHKLKIIYAYISIR